MDSYGNELSEKNVTLSPQVLLCGVWILEYGCVYVVGGCFRIKSDRPQPKLAEKVRELFYTIDVLCLVP